MCEHKTIESYILSNVLKSNQFEGISNGQKFLVEGKVAKF